MAGKGAEAGGRATIRMEMLPRRDPIGIASDANEGYEGRAKERDRERLLYFFRIIPSSISVEEGSVVEYERDRGAGIAFVRI